MSLGSQRFAFHRYVAFCETDAMGVVHHANYVRYFEEARVAWMRHHGLNECHYPNSDHVLAVLNSQCEHLQPMRFGDHFTVSLQLRAKRLRIQFRYAIFLSDQVETPVALGQTELVFVNRDLRPVRWPAAFKNQMEKEIWIETWPLSLCESRKPPL